MNQSILFPDVQNWDESAKRIVFPAQCNGALIECVVSIESLSALSGEKIISGEQALACFARFRFDLEDQAEVMIEDEQFNTEGKIEVVG